MRAEKNQHRGSGIQSVGPTTSPWKTLERQQVARRRAEAENPAGKTSGGELVQRFMPLTERGVKQAAWDESRATTDAAGDLGSVARASGHPSSYFVGVELGFAHEHRPSIVETMGGLTRSTMEAVAHQRYEPQAEMLLRETRRSERVTGRKAQRALRKKVREAQAERVG